MLAVVIVATIHFAEWRKALDVIRKIKPVWLVAAAGLQAGTYLAQGLIWRRVTRKAGTPIPLGAAYKLSLTKLFVDQALPTGGVSGTVVFGKSLEHYKISTRVIMAAVVVATASFYIAYTLALAVAAVIITLSGLMQPLVVAAFSIFLAFSALMMTTILVSSGEDKDNRLTRFLHRIPLLKKAVRLLDDADPDLAHHPGLISQATLFQLAIILLDTATVWVLILALGAHVAPPRLFASFMISDLLRSMSFVPGGLGPFEAASVVTLKMAGAGLAVALSATLLFRALSFWLPLVPGFIFSREQMKAESKKGPRGPKASSTRPA